MKVEMAIEGVSHVADLSDGPLWLRWRVGARSGETKEAVPTRHGNVEWNEVASFKTTFKSTSKGDGYERKTCVLTLKGKRNRTSFTLGTLTIDLSLYVRDTPTMLHFNFESGGKTLPSTCEFRGRIRVMPDGSRADPLDVSSTMNDSDDEDDEEKTRTEDFVPGRPKKFLLTTEEVARKGAVRGAGGALSPAMQMQDYEEQLKELRRKAMLDRRDVEAKHQAELARLQQQLKVASIDNAAKLKALQEDLQRARDAASSVTVAQLRTQKDEAENQSREKTQTIQGLRDQLNDALARLTEQTSVSARLEATLQRLEKEVAVLRTEKEERRREAAPERKERRSQTVDNATPAASGKDGGAAAAGGAAKAVPKDGAVSAFKPVMAELVTKQKDPAGEPLGSSKPEEQKPRQTLSSVLSARRKRPTVELPLAEDSGGMSVRVLAVIVLFIAFGFFIYKKLR